MGRSPDPHGRVLLDFDHCPKDELGFALASVAQMAPGRRLQASSGRHGER
jgi:hypothetical protein